MKKMNVAAIALLLATVSLHAAPAWHLIAWNDLGMHCTDGTDYSVFGVLPPFNTVHAQLIDPNGRLVTSPNGIVVTYESVADTRGSLNTTSRGKTNFWRYVDALFGARLPVDEGLAGFAMPGPLNVPRAARFDSAQKWFTLEGVPITPRDDRGFTNFYPMFLLVARDASGNVLATTRVVTPVSDEMDCASCHASGSVAAARPQAGWAFDTDRNRDVKINILRLHDERTAALPLFAAALAGEGYDSAGLLASSQGGKPVLCARCHSSNALPGLGFNGVSPLTTAVHRRHALVTDPLTGSTLDASSNRTACYRCHPGSETKCLRGAMGAAVGSDRQFSMNCQSCHGTMSTVAAANRQGWLDQPRCQSCHTGTATQNSGQIRYTNAFVTPGVYRTAANAVFATTPDVPVAGVSLFRFSTGHAGLQCEGCHGSTHAEYPSTEANDNVQTIALQGHAGVVAECTSCHPSVPATTAGGPHGLHPIGQSWVKGHESPAEHGRDACAACHGSDFRGTVLSRALGDRQLSTEFGTKNFFRGQQIGCYSCHDGPSSEQSARNRPPVVSNASVTAAAGGEGSVTLIGTDPDGNQLTWRVVTQPRHGRVGISGNVATIAADAGFAGDDSFTFSAWDGTSDSNLATATVHVTAATHRLTVVKSGTGTVLSNDGAITCGSSCTADEVAGTKVQLAAEAAPDMYFSGWSGACSGRELCTVTLSEDRRVDAIFVPVERKRSVRR